MTDLLIAFSCVVFFAASHMLGFRLKLFKFQTSVILMLFGFWLAVCFAILTFFRQGQGELASNDFWNTRLIGSACFIYLLTGLWYANQMVVLQYGSPSLSIMEVLANHPDETSAHQQLSQIFTNDKLLFPRLSDLVAHGHVGQKGIHYFLRPRGVLTVRLIQTYRALLARELGG